MRRRLTDWQKARYESEFGPVVNDRCLLLPDLCGDKAVTEAEQLLDDVDRQKAIDAVFSDAEGLPKPTKALSQAVLELDARREAVSLESASSERLVTVLDRLGERLAAQDPLAEGEPG